jgi:CcmD family protein
MTTRHPLRALALSLALALSPLAASAQNAPAAPGDRSMAFQPGLGDAARERIPGGRLVITAYAAVLLLIGGYVAFVARKASKLEGDLRRLEDDLARRAPDGDKP